MYPNHNRIFLESPPKLNNIQTLRENLPLHFVWPIKYRLEGLKHPNWYLLLFAAIQHCPNLYENMLPTCLETFLIE